MWNNIKQQLVEKILEEFKSQQNWDLLKKYMADDTIDTYLIYPLITKFNLHLKKYLLIFVAIHTLIILLIIFNIFISLYHKK
jgi:hypothetical protein